jgi:DNA-binding GntR family transcriptional regulator
MDMAVKTRPSKLPLKPGRPSAAVRGEPRKAQPPKSKMKATEVAIQLRHLIQAGQLQPGDWLREVPFSEKFGTTRATVHEAFRLLRDDGLLELERFRGARVTTPSLHQMFDLFEVRAALFGLVVRYACFRAPEPALKEIVKKIEEMVRHAEKHSNPELIIHMGIEIGGLITRHASTEARHMMGASDRRARWHYSYLGLSSSPGALGAVGDWRLLCKMLSARDAEGAATIARRIIYFMQQEVMKLLVARGVVSEGAA